MARRAVTERSDADRQPMMMPPGFVGREQDMAALGRALAAPPAVVLIEGEAGIGKSRLLQEYLASAEGRARRAFVASCPPFRQPCTLGPVVDAIRQATDDVTGLRLSALAGTLRPLFPEWADGLPCTPEAAEDAPAARHRLFRALAELLGCLEMAVLVAEDVHWADEATLEFLLFLVSRQPQQVSVVVTYRPEDVPAGSLLLRLSSLRPTGTTRLRLVLRPLDVGATAGLMSSMLAGAPVSAEFAAFVRERTDGVPLAVEESVRLMGDRGDVCRRDGGWVRRHLAEIAVPPTIRDSVLERAGRLSLDGHAVIRAAAVLTDPGPEGTLAVIAGLPAQRVRAGLAEALGSGLLAEHDRGLLAFRHVLAGRAVYEAIPGPDRRALHLRAGHALEDCSPLPVTRLARHFREASETSSWCRYAEQAADLALASGDEAAAAALLHDLVVNAGLPAGSMIRLTNKIPLDSSVGPIPIRDLARTLRSLLGAGTSGAAEKAAIRFQLGRVLTAMGDLAMGRIELERAIPHLGHDSIEAARAMMILGWPHNTRWPAQVHRRWLRRAADVMVTIPSADRLRFRVDRMSALLLLGDEDGWEEAAGIPDDPPADRDGAQITRGHLNIGDLAMRWGRYDEAGRRLAKALDLATSHQYSRLQDEILGYPNPSGLVHRHMGQADRARECPGRQPGHPVNDTAGGGSRHRAAAGRHGRTSAD